MRQPFDKNQILFKLYHTNQYQKVKKMAEIISLMDFVKLIIINEYSLSFSNNEIKVIIK